MADLIVRPAYQFGPTDILTADKLNLMGTPIVELSISDRVDDQSFLRNGNFYSSFWTNVTPTGVSCPVGVETSNADYWTINPNGAAVVCVISSTVPDLFSLFSMEIQGAAGATDVRMSQIINADLSATLRRVCTFSGYIYNGAGLAVSPQLEVWTNNTFNNFNTLTFQQAEDIQTCAPGLWTYVSVTFDLTSITNVANGLRITTLIPSGALNATTKSILFSRIKFQIGELATEFVDDVGLFVQTPSVDSTMLQDGCIARPQLFLPNVIPIGTYEAKSIQNGDLGDGVVDGRVLVQSVTTTLTAGFVQPAVAATVSIAVTSTVGFQANQPINIIGGGAYTISSITDATHMVVTNSGGAGNAAPAALVPTGGAVYQASGVIENLGYVPVNKAGDLNVGPLEFTVDTVVGNLAPVNAAVSVSLSSANAANAGYFPAIGFTRGSHGVAVGLDLNDNLAVINEGGISGRLLDSVHGVDTNSYQPGSITYDKLAQSLINLVCPIGMVVPFAGVSTPGGWIICDGSAFSRTAYAALFAKLGTYWGGGDGINTFNVPNFVNRVPVGYGSGSFWAFGTYGGETSHQMSLGEMPAHDHGYSQSPHDHGTHAQNLVTLAGAGSGLASGPNWALGTVSVSASGVPASNANISFTGQGGWAAHNNMQPFGVIYYIIKAV